MQVALIANGEFSFTQEIENTLKKFDQIIAVDGGLNHCHTLKISPNLIIGDLDSVHPDLLPYYSNTPTIKLPTHKDKTDLEIAIETTLTPSTTITIFGALGNRADHTLYNLILLSRYPGNVIYLSHNEEVTALKKNTQILTTIGETLSLLAVNGPTSGITTQGLKWNLKEATFDQNFMSISNEAISEQVEIHFHTGNLLCFREAIAK